MGDRVGSVRRRHPGNPRGDLRRCPGPVHRTQAVHRQHRSRDRRILRLRRRNRQDRRRARRSGRCGCRSRRVLEETSSLLVAKHGIDAAMSQRAYREKILVRFANPHLPDTVQRVGRQPLRKLSRNERFISPATQLAEAGTQSHRARRRDRPGTPASTYPDDEQSVEMHPVARRSDRTGLR